jgi:hypothetical protein
VLPATCDECAAPRRFLRKSGLLNHLPI